MKRFGLIGYPVSHSFSKGYFTEKFEKLGLTDHVYELFAMQDHADFPKLWGEYADLVGVNVTVPHKENVLSYLSTKDHSCETVGAANVICKKNEKLVGYNTDYIAFKNSLKNWVGDYEGSALVLGTGGASKAVQAALSDLGIAFHLVSRSVVSNGYTYDDLNTDTKIVADNFLIINTTPLGMHPNVSQYPELPYQALKSSHYLYDLVYNPEETAFLRKGKRQGAATKNGLEMLHLQAEESWKIWNQA